MNSRKLFKYWFGIGAPLYFFVGLGLAFSIHILFGLAVTGLYVWRVYDSFQTTCSRCAFYGTYDCGLPGKIVPIFLKRNTNSVSKSRVYLHYLTDIIVTLFVLAIYSWFGICAVLIGLVWPIGAYMISFGPKRYHGLMHRLKNNEFVV